MREEIDEGGGGKVNPIDHPIYVLNSDGQSQKSSSSSNMDDDCDDGDDYETAITATGYGLFHYLLILVGGFANASDAIEILCVSILLPAAECDLHMTSEDKGWLTAVPFIGMMLGGYIWGCLGDIYGRRSVLIVALLVNALAGLGSSFVQTFPWFLVLRLISGLGVGGSIPLVWAYVSEFQLSSNRGRALSIIAAFWMVGNIIVAIFAIVTIPYDIGFEAPGYEFHSWRVFIVICALPSLIIGIVLIWMPESPMFLLMKDRKTETLDVLKKMFSLNTKQDPHQYPITQLSRSGLKVQKETTQTWWRTFTSTVLQFWRQTKALFCRSLIRVTMLILAINFSIQFGYYGLWLWFPELFNRLELYYKEHPDDHISVCELKSNQTNSSTIVSQCDREDGKFVDINTLYNTLIIAVSAFPANLWTIFHMDKLGRKFFLVLSMILSGGSAFGVYLVKSAIDNLVLACVFGAFATMGFNALDCLGAELFPTHLRSTALAVSLFAARVGAIVGTVSFGYLVDVNCAVPLFLVAGLLILGGLLGIPLPNTTRTALT